MKSVTLVVVRKINRAAWCFLEAAVVKSEVVSGTLLRVRSRCFQGEKAR